MSLPPAAFFATVYQYNIPGLTEKLTNFKLPSQSFFIGIPYIIAFPCADTPNNAADALNYYDPATYNTLNKVPGLMDYIRGHILLDQGCSKKIGLWGTDTSKDNNFQKQDDTFYSINQSDYNTIAPILYKLDHDEPITDDELATLKKYINIKGVMMYTNHGYFQYETQLFYFSTLDNGTTLYYGKTFDFGIFSYTISGINVNPDNPHIYNVYRYFTYLKHDDVNLNTTPSFLLGWGSSDLDGLTGNYGADVAMVSMYHENGKQQGVSFPVTYNYKFDDTLIVPGTDPKVKVISTIPSGRYYYTYDFASPRIAAIQAAEYTIYDDASGNSSIQKTSVFTFITKFLQSITAGNIVSGGTTTIIPDFGIGYPLNTYQITINDDTNSTRRAALYPVLYQYTPPITPNTRTYLITVNGSSDTYDTATHTTSFTSYRYVENLAVATKMIGSARNYVTWTGGSLEDQFKYGTTSITKYGTTNTNFTSGNAMETSRLTAGLGYLIVPTNDSEKKPGSSSYSTVYFDSVTPNTLVISSAHSQQQYTLSWKSYYIYTQPAPDGTRQYPITVTGNSTTKTFTSLYNVVQIPYSEVAQNVPYTIQVLDITIATNVYFFDIPYDIVISPSRINFVNTITLTAFVNLPFEVQMGGYFFQDSSPSTQSLTEHIIQTNGDISFRPVSSTVSYITGGIYNLSANTIYVALPSPVFFFSGVYLAFDVGPYLYTDTYSLALYRNGVVVQQLETLISNPYTWYPYKYVVTYQPGDQICVQSNQHLNYGLSLPITFVVNASVALDPEYTVLSTIVATMTIDATATFTARLRGPVTVPVTFTQQGNQYTIPLKNYNIPLGNYQLDFVFVNSPTIIVTSPTFLVTTGVTVDQPEYTIISTVNATLYVGVPTTFTVTLQDVDHLFPPIALPSFTANLLSTYSFKLYGLPVKDANYILQFTSGIILTSPVFAVSTSYFSLEKPVIPPPPSRGTPNQLCVTNKKNNIPTTIISIVGATIYPTAVTGKPQFLVPCGILPYLKELSSLLATLSLRDALLFLIQKYNIPQNMPAVTNKPRIKYPTANFKVLKPILQYPASFRLASSTTGVSVGYDIRFVDKLTDARIVTLCNDDTKTFSTAYTDMLTNATYWLSTIPPFTKDGDFTYCVVRPVNGSLKQILTASITLTNNRLVFTPYILRLVLAFYQPYGAIDMTIMYSSKSIKDIYNYLVAAYEKIYLNPATAL